MLRPGVAPARTVKMGRTVLLEPLSVAKHAADIWATQDDDIWRYLPDGPFATWEVFAEAMQAKQDSKDMFFWAIVDRPSGKARGVAAVMSIDLKNAVSEIGNVLLTKSLQHTTQATEAFFLFLCICFDEMGSRRCVWKCNNENEPSKRAAARLGFTFEGVHRQAMIVKGRNRDTAWFSMLDSEWPARKQRFEAWLRPDNFDEAGRQKTRL
jgi:RimJ/RimL family protein N-acetyltransferase